MMSQELPRAGDAWDEARKSAIVSQIAAEQLSVEAACRRYGLELGELQDWLRAYRRSALLAYDERLQQTLVRQGADAAALAPAEFTGTLQDLSVPDLIQSLQIAGKSGVIVVTHEGLESRVWCAAGSVIDADSGQLGGEAALYRILSFEQGRVTAELRPVVRGRTIHASTPGLLLEAAYRKDKSARLWRKLGDTESAPAPSGSSSSEMRDSMSSFLTSTGTRLSQRAAARSRLLPGWAWAALGAALLLSIPFWLRRAAPPREVAALTPAPPAPAPAVSVEAPAGAPEPETTQAEPAETAGAAEKPPAEEVRPEAPSAAPVPAVPVPAVPVPTPVTVSSQAAPLPGPRRVESGAKLSRRAQPSARKPAAAPARRPEASGIEKIDPELPHIQVIE